MIDLIGEYVQSTCHAYVQEWKNKKTNLQSIKWSKEKNITQCQWWQMTPPPWSTKTKRNESIADSKDELLICITDHRHTATAAFAISFWEWRTLRRLFLLASDPAAADTMYLLLFLAIIASIKQRNSSLRSRKSDGKENTDFQNSKSNLGDWCEKEQRVSSD